MATTVQPERAAILLDIELKMAFGASIAYAIAIPLLCVATVAWAARGPGSLRRTHRAGASFFVLGLLLHLGWAGVRLASLRPDLLGPYEPFLAGGLAAALMGGLGLRSGDRPALALAAVAATVGIVLGLGRMPGTPEAVAGPGLAPGLIVVGSGLLVGAACHAGAALLGVVAGRFGALESSVVRRLGDRAHRATGYAVLGLGAGILASAVARQVVGPSFFGATTVECAALAALAVGVVALGTGSVRAHRSGRTALLTLVAAGLLAGLVVPAVDETFADLPEAVVRDAS